jgi:hypothetical protein
VLHQLLRHPGDILGANDQVGAVRPEAEASKAAERTPGFPHADHDAGGFGVEGAAAAPPASGSDFSEITSNAIHVLYVKRLMM